jgi:alkaline phosphatase
MRKIFKLLILIIFLVSCNSAQENEAAAPTATAEPIISIVSTLSDSEHRNLILFIGDGMGADHRLGGQYISVGEDGELVMDTLPVSGWLHTSSLGGVLTDSAAGATAYATGSKTYNDVISMDTSRNELKTILEYAQELGMSVGLVSTKYISDATTAAFASHVWSRDNSSEVASQFLEHGVDVIFGGGENDFLPRGVEGCLPETGSRSDERNLVEEAVEADYVFVCDAESFDSLDPQSTTLVLGIFADESMLRPYEPTLAEMTRKAIEILSQNPKGFFLLVEGGMIDIASHQNESQNALDDVIGLDEAVMVGLEFSAIDEDTLIIVAADHETGGLEVYMDSTDVYDEEGPFYMPDGTEFYLRWDISRHTDADVPVSAYGPGSEQLSGTNENTVVFDVMLEFLGFVVVVE